MKIKIPPLEISEQIDETNLHLLSIVEYRRSEFIGIIDNITRSDLKIYLVDQKRPDALAPSLLISHAIDWFYKTSHLYPFSIYLASKGLSELTAPLYRNFDIKGISRVIGNAFRYPNLNKITTKKRRILPIPEGIEIKLKKIRIEE